MKLQPCLNCTKPEAHTSECHIGCKLYEEAVANNKKIDEQIRQAKEKERLDVIWNRSRKVEVAKNLANKRKGK